MRFYIELKTPPFRAIYCTEIKAENEEKAIELFTIANPSSKIRKIEAIKSSSLSEH